MQVRMSKSDHDKAWQGKKQRLFQAKKGGPGIPNGPLVLGLSVSLPQCSAGGAVRMLHKGAGMIN